MKSNPSVIGSDKTGCRVARASLLFVVSDVLPQDTARQAGGANLTGGLDQDRHRRTCGLLQPRPRDGTSGLVSVRRRSQATASRPQQNSVPSRHKACSTVASLRATATLARRIPARLATLKPQAFKADQRLVRVRSTLAAS